MFCLMVSYFFIFFPGECPKTVSKFVWWPVLDILASKVQVGDVIHTESPESPFSNMD